MDIRIDLQRIIRVGWEMILFDKDKVLFGIFLESLMKGGVGGTKIKNRETQIVFVVLEGGIFVEMI